MDTPATAVIMLLLLSAVVVYLSDAKLRGTLNSWASGAGRLLGSALRPRPTEKYVDGVKVGISRHPKLLARGGSRWRTRLVVTGLPVDLTLGPRGLAAGLKAAIERGEVVDVGDPDFDRRVSARGQRASVLARLDAETRLAAVAAVTRGATLSGGRLTLEAPGLVRSPTALRDVTGVVARLARALGAQSRGRDDRLFTIANADPVPRVRDGALVALLEHAPGSPEAEAAVSGALARRSVSPDDPLALLSAARSDRLELALPAIAQLERSGTGTHLEALRARSLDAAAPRILRVRADRAVRAIRARSEPGGLAMVDAEPVGGLAMAEAGGEISVAEPEEDLA